MTELDSYPLEGVEVSKLDFVEDREGWSLCVYGDGAEVTPQEAWLMSLRPGGLRAWLMSSSHMSLAGLRGTVEVVIHDGRKGSPTEGETFSTYTGERSHKLVTIPPDVHYGYKNVGKSLAILVRCSSNISTHIEKVLPYDSEEIEYEWMKRTSKRII